MTSILLVDANAQQRSLATKRLREHGHDVREFERSNELPAVEPGSLAIVVERDHEMDVRDRTSGALVHAVMITDDWKSGGTDKGNTRTMLWLRSKPIDAEELTRLVENWDGRWSHDD